MNLCGGPLHKLVLPKVYFQVIYALITTGIRFQNRLSSCELKLRQMAIVFVCACLCVRECLYERDGERVCVCVCDVNQSFFKARPMNYY